MQVNDQKNAIVGVLYIVLGLAVALLATQLSMGTARSMGPGFFPFYVGLALSLTGVIVTALAITTKNRTALGRIPLKIMAAVILSLVAFALTVERFGFVVAIVIVIAISSIARKKYSVAEVAKISIVMVPLTYIIFGLLLGQPIHLFAMNI